jgi:hypothetical protein
MGRPIHKKYFGNRNDGSIGGEGVASVAVVNTGSLHVSEATAAVSAPQLPGGITATVSLTVNSGFITNVAVTNAGSGYTSVPTLTVSPATTGTTASFTVSLTDTNENGIAVSAWVPGDNQARVADAVKQVSSTRYRVATSAGAGVCKLVPNAPAGERQMSIIAEDSAGDTYFVTKLTSRRATIVADTGTQFDNDTSVGWSLLAAIAGTTVKIRNA